MSYNIDNLFWLEDNTTEMVESGIECPECGCEMMIADNDTSYTNVYRVRRYHLMECSNDNCNHTDKILIQ